MTEAQQFFFVANLDADDPAVKQQTQVVYELRPDQVKQIVRGRRGRRAISVPTGLTEAAMIVPAKGKGQPFPVAVHLLPTALDDGEAPDAA